MQQLDPQAGWMSTSILAQSLALACPAALFVSITGTKTEISADNSLDHCSMTEAEALQVGRQGSQHTLCRPQLRGISNKPD